MGEQRPFKDIEYTRVGDRSLLLDIDLPDEGAGPFPVVVWIHGGGWNADSKEGRPVVRLVDDELRRLGYAIVAIDHRLSKEALFPAQILDCKGAVRWIRANAERYSLDSDRIGAWGFSSGGHLAALLGTTGDSQTLGDEGDNRQYSDRVQAVCTFAAPLDFTAQLPELESGSDEIYEMAFSAEKQLLGVSPLDDPTLAQSANPIAYVSSQSAPFLLITGEDDELIPVSQGELMANALRQAGVAASTYVIPHGPHGMAGLDEHETRKIISLAVAFFDANLKGSAR